MSADRRHFLKQVAALTGGAGMLHFFPESLARAVAIDATPGSTYLDAEHVVFLMQENRSFDHTYGTLQGVRGFEDPRVARRADGFPVWLQQDKKGDTYAPFRMDIHNTKATWMSSLPHSWENQVDARNNGHYDRWLEVKQSGHPDYRDMPLTLGYYNREDLPYYYSLADAFTVCDQNFCSALTGTTPNRLYFWTGTIRQDDQPGTQARVWNGDADYDRMPSWKTFPEELSDAGVDWKIYQNEISAGVGFEGEEDSWLANFTDNPIEFFEQYQVRLTPEYRAGLPKVERQIGADIAETRQKIAAIDPLKQDQATAKELKELNGRLDWLTKRLGVNKQEQLTCTQEAWDKLPANIKEIHTRAFTNNRNDPNYHSLEEISYSDSGTPKTMLAPKGDVLHQFRTDVQQGKLPTVSWLVPPECFSDHPSSAWYGAWYISEVMDILTKDPEVWKKTIFVLTYDENDGYFDHGAPFVAPHPEKKETGYCSPGIDPAAEYVQTTQEQSSEPGDARISPIGLGFRVPLVIASPWSKGGFVNSQVFDHTSSLRMLENILSHKTGRKIEAPRISDWRRAVCGDLGSVFRAADEPTPPQLKPIDRKPFLTGIHQAQFRPAPGNFTRIDEVKRGTKATPELLKAVELKMTRQEPGTRPSNAIPYELELNLHRTRDQLQLSMTAATNRFGEAAAGAPFTVYARGNYAQSVNPSRNYALKAGTSLQDEWKISEFGNGSSFELEAYGPNGFYRRFMGGAGSELIQVSLKHAGGKTSRSVELTIQHVGNKELSLLIDQRVYDGASNTITLKPGKSKTIMIDLGKTQGWYDVQVTITGDAVTGWHYAGRIETGRAGITDPLIGRS